jgi:hypothetical protein
MSHARLGPSNHRWPHCAGSVREEAKYPDVSNPAAIDGTGSHLLLEFCINQTRTAASFIGELIGVGDREKPEGWLVDEARAARVDICLGYIERRKSELAAQFPDAHIKVEAERKANAGGLFGRTDWWGTCDITISVFDTATAGLLFLEVCDYKDGQGWVSEKDNSQLQSYLAGQMRPYIGSGPELVGPFKTEKIGGTRMSIVQPKTSIPIRYQDSSAADVMNKVDILAFAAYQTDKPDAPLTAGKHCQWCKANPKRGGHCTAAAEQGLEVVKSMSNDLVIENGGSLFEVMSQMVKDTSALTNEQLAQFADAKDPMVAAFVKVEEEIQARLELGQQVSGYAMLPSNSSYVWNADAKEIEKALKGRRLKLADIYPPKLISPAQLKKLPTTKLTVEQKKRIEKDYISEKVGKLALRKVARKEKESAEQMFAGIQKPVAEVAALEEISFL